MGNVGNQTVLCGNKFQSGMVLGSRKERALDPELTGSCKHVFCGDLLGNL